MSKLHRIVLFNGIAFVGLGTWAFFIGRYETLYGAGAAGVLVITGFAFLVGFIAMFFLSEKKLAKAFNISFSGANAFYLFVIIFHLVDAYKPTYKISAPAHYEGCIYLFYSKEPIEDIFVDEHGIGYLAFGKNANYEFYLGDQEVPKVQEKGGFGMPGLIYADTTRIKQIKVTCLQVGVEGSQLQAQGGTYNCLDWKEFQELADLGWVDTSRIKFYDKALEPAEIVHFKQLAKEGNWPPM